jgi:hypothetical protein
MLLQGGTGNDVLKASTSSPESADYALAQAVLDGGEGDDRLEANGVLQLTLTGGAGTDTFVLTAQQYQAQLKGTLQFALRSSLRRPTAGTTASRPSPPGPWKSPTSPPAATASNSTSATCCRTAPPTTTAPTPSSPATWTSSRSAPTRSQVRRRRRRRQLRHPGGAEGRARHGAGGQELQPAVRHAQRRHHERLARRQRQARRPGRQRPDGGDRRAHRRSQLGPGLGTGARHHPRPRRRRQHPGRRRRCRHHGRRQRQRRLHRRQPGRRGEGKGRAGQCRQGGGGHRLRPARRGRAPGADRLPLPRPTAMPRTTSSQANDRGNE